MGRIQREGVLDLAGVDWQKAWEMQDSRKTRPPDALQWTKRSKSYAGDAGVGSYEREFIERSGIVPGDTVLDFGCGVGLLAVPLAQMGCTVLACDFSQGMLDQLRERARAAGVESHIQARLLAWDEDWQAAGIMPRSVDVAIASRSIATTDLLGALSKLDRTARRRVCVTVAAGMSPRRDERAFEAVGRRRPLIEDFAFCANILFQHGVFPEISYIVTHSRPGFSDRTEAFAGLCEMMGGDLSAEERSLLDAYLDEHYSTDPAAHPDRAFACDSMREVRWAFISW